MSNIKFHLGLGLSPFMTQIMKLSLCLWNLQEMWKWEWRTGFKVILTNWMPGVEAISEIQRVIRDKLYTCAGTIHLNRIQNNCLGNILQSRVWDYSRWQLNMSQQCHICEKSSIISRSYWKNKNLQFLKKFHAEAAVAFGSVLTKTFQLRKSKRELAEWWEDRKSNCYMFSSWCELKSGRLKKIKLFSLKRRRLRR